MAPTAWRSRRCIPGAAFRNLDYTERETRFDEGLDYNLKMIAHDAQTSGGLLDGRCTGKSGVTAAGAA
ncbi:MAG: hypothetical protein MZV63_38820 [Marinilabiliales bacterium]|nr:hypothetical protein [Marinilabiliales bacterium]